MREAFFLKTNIKTKHQTSRKVQDYRVRSAAFGTLYQYNVSSKRSMDKEIRCSGSTLDLVIIFALLVLCVMVRFYADLNKLKQNETFNITKLTHMCTMPLIEYFFKQATPCPVDRGGNSVMDHTKISPSTDSSSEEKFDFDWFSFESTKSSNRKSLQISPISPPAQQRRLSISTASPTSYFLDDCPSCPSAMDSPVSNQDQQLKHHRTLLSKLVLPPQPISPLTWVWQCHVCRSRYPLAVTRRCLIDGHYYCSGNSAQRNGKRHKSHKSCTSEFDYVNWQNLGQWRRKCMALKTYVAGEKDGPTLVGCEGCNFPSQCRYESRPSEEKLSFEKYISQKDLKTLMNDTTEQAARPKTTQRHESVYDRSSNTKSQAKANRHLTTMTGPPKDTISANGSSKLNSSVLKDSQKSISKRQRFYSSFGANVMTNKNDPKREDRGRFDTNLPSITAHVSSGPSSPILYQNETRVPLELSKVEAAELSLKAALGCQNTESLSPNTHPNVSPSSNTTSQRLHSSHGRRRINSKAKNPEFEITKQDIMQYQHSTPDATAGPVSILPRTTSYQNLLPDLIRQGKDREHHKQLTEKARRAASEADIAAFLSLDTLQGTKLNRPRQQSDGIAKEYFEDIDLSPSKPASLGVFSEMLDDSDSQEDGGLGSGSPVDISATKSANAPLGGGDLGVGFLSFGLGFGRK